MIVVDTNLIGYLFLESERTIQAEQALLIDSEWASPLLWRSEFRNVLAIQVRNKGLALPDAQAMMQQAEMLLKGKEFSVASAEVIRLAVASGCSAYDCEFVALAKDLNLPLVTVDRKILAQFPETAIALETFI